MDNPEKLVTLEGHKKTKTKKVNNKTKNKKKVKMNRTSFIYGNRNEHHNTW
jgi:hypothetical protein